MQTPQCVLVTSPPSRRTEFDIGAVRQVTSSLTMALYRYYTLTSARLPQLLRLLLTALALAIAIRRRPLASGASSNCLIRRPSGCQLDTGLGTEVQADTDTVLALALLIRSLELSTTTRRRSSMPRLACGSVSFQSSASSHIKPDRPKT